MVKNILFGVKMFHCVLRSAATW